MNLVKISVFSLFSGLVVVGVWLFSSALVMVWFALGFL